MLAAEILRTFHINPSPNLIFSGTVSHSNITKYFEDTFPNTAVHKIIYKIIYIYSSEFSVLGVENSVGNSKNYNLSKIL